MYTRRPTVLFATHCRSEPQMAAFLPVVSHKRPFSTRKPTHGGNLDNDIIGVLDSRHLDVLDPDLVGSDIVDGAHRLGGHGNDDSKNGWWVADETRARGARISTDAVSPCAIRIGDRSGLGSGLAMRGRMGRAHQTCPAKTKKQFSPLVETRCRVRGVGHVWVSSWTPRYRRQDAYTCPAAHVVHGICPRNLPESALLSFPSRGWMRGGFAPRQPASQPSLRLDSLC
jgi:hypothetical protein